jgi:hypothetical protein
MSSPQILLEQLQKVLSGLSSYFSECRVTGAKSGNNDGEGRGNGKVVPVLN